MNQEKLFELLSDFVMDELKDDIVLGVTYTFVLDEELNKERAKEIQNLISELEKSGYKGLVNIYRVQNGYVIDLDFNVAYNVLAKIIESGAGEKQEAFKVMIEKVFLEKRNNDIKAFVNFIKKAYKNKERIVKLALYSRNKVNRVVINKDFEVSAFALTYNDIVEISNNYLNPLGIYIKNINTGGILPSKTGLYTEIELE